MKVGLCGVGDRLAYVARVFDKLIPDFDICAAVDPDPVRVELLRNEGILSGACYADLDTMLSRERCDLVMVGTPNSYHLEDIRRCLHAGVRVFSEKPVVTTPEQTFELLALLAKYGVEQVMVGMVLRYAPLFQDLKQAIDSGRIGELVSIDASEHIAPEHGAFFMRDWRRLSEISGGFMLEKCCHDLDLYCSLSSSRAARVSSFGGRRVFTGNRQGHERHSVYHERKSRWAGSNRVFSDDGDLVDHQTALVEYANGVQLCFHTNLNAPDEIRRFCIIGTDGMAEGDFVRGYFRVHDALTGDCLVDKTYDYTSDVSMHYGAEEQMAAELSAHFEKGRPLPVSVIDALEAGLVAMQIDQSRLQGATLDFTEIWARFDSYISPDLKTAGAI